MRYTNIAPPYLGKQIAPKTDVFLVCSDFERLMVAMTSFLHQARKRKEPMDEYLGEIMDFVYRKASVLQEAHDHEEEG